MKDIKTENSLIEKSIEDISESIVKLKLSDKDKLTISSNSKISELLSSLYQSDPFENIKPKYLISYNQTANEFLIEKQLIRIEDLSKKEEPIHPFFAERQSNPLINNNTKEKTILNIDDLENVIIFSPHPDDDILGACALIHQLLKRNKNIKIVYMTSGKSAGSSDIRKEEARNAVRVLGGDKDNLVFINLPFYEKSDRKVTEEDYAFLLKFLEEYKPSNIFICADTFDPHLTHRKCFDVIISVLLKNLLLDIQAYFYYSIWYIPKEDEFTHIIPYDFELYKLKVNSMLEHKSQFETKFMGSDPRPFYQRAISRDSSFGKRFNFEFCEVYYKLKKNC